MKPTIYQYIGCVVGLLVISLIGIFALISSFITHADQPAIGGSVSVFLIFIGLILIMGIVQLRNARKQGLQRAWYQQYEIPFALAFFSMSGTFAVVAMLPYIRIKQTSTFLLSVFFMFAPMFLALFFFALSFKYRPKYGKE